MRVQARSIPTWTAAAIMLAIFAAGALRYEHFGAVSNVTNLLTDYSYVAIAAVGATLVILLGGIDLSVGSVVAFSGVMMAMLIGHGWHPLCAATVCLVIGAGLGGAMGLLIQVFELPAFMVTLVGMFAVRAAAFLVLAQSARMDHPFLGWMSHQARITVAGVDVSWRMMVAGAVVGGAFVLMRWTRFGRSVYAIGGSERSAGMMSVPLARTRVLTYAIAGLCSAMAGCVLAMGRRAADPSSGIGLELTVIAAVVIGGTLLSGGGGSVLGTVVGVLIIGLIRMIIDFEGTLNAAWTSVATGGLLLVFVVLQKLTSSLSLQRRWWYGGGGVARSGSRGRVKEVGCACTFIEHRRGCGWVGCRGWCGRGMTRRRLWRSCMRFPSPRSRSRIRSGHRAGR